MMILGIDPGTAIVGFGVIKKEKNKLTMIDAGCIYTDKDTTTALRLHQVDKELKKIITKHKPEIIAVEDIFFFKNLKTAVTVAQARGVILARSANMGVDIMEFTPLQIKQAVTSYGRADKNQVQQMVKMLLNLKQIPKPDDAADALACAICCAHTL